MSGSPVRHDESGVLIGVESISKAYREIRALTRVSLTLRRGSIHALVGPNGAGKSTLIRILMGLDSPDAGQLSRPAADARRLAIAYQPQVPALYDYLTVSEFLELAARIGGEASVERCDDVMRLFGLSSIAAQLVRTTSAGTRMKLALAAAIVQDPDLLILDEPTNAVDAIGVARLKDRLRTLRAGGTTILLATHMIDFADGLCDDITVLLGGAVQYSGPVSALGAAATPLESRVLALIDAEAG